MSKYRKGQYVVRNAIRADLGRIKEGTKGTVVEEHYRDDRSGLVRVLFEGEIQSAWINEVYLDKVVGVIYRINGNDQWTETFDADQIRTLKNLGLIKHNVTVLHDDYTIKIYGTTADTHGKYSVVDRRTQQDKTLIEQYPQEK